MSSKWSNGGKWNGRRVRFGRVTSPPLVEGGHGLAYSQWMLKVRRLRSMVCREDAQNSLLWPGAWVVVAVLLDTSTAHLGGAK